MAAGTNSFPERARAFLRKKRGICPSNGARRMVETAAHLVDHVIPHVPVRQGVLSFPWPVRMLFAARPEAPTRCLDVVVRCIETRLMQRAGLRRANCALCGTMVPTDELTPSALGVPEALLADVPALTVEGRTTAWRLLSAGCMWLDAACDGHLAAAAEIARRQRARACAPCPGTRRPAASSSCCATL